MKELFGGNPSKLPANTNDAIIDNQPMRTRPGLKDPGGSSEDDGVSPFAWRWGQERAQALEDLIASAPDDNVANPGKSLSYSHDVERGSLGNSDLVTRGRNRPIGVRGQPGTGGAGIDQFDILNNFDASQYSLRSG